LVEISYDSDFLRGWLDVCDLLFGVVVDDDLCWWFVYWLVMFGVVMDDDIVVECRCDFFSSGVWYVLIA